MAEKSEDENTPDDAVTSSTSNQFGGRADWAVQVGHVSGPMMINVAGSSSATPSSEDSVPQLAFAVVPRPELLDQLIRALRAESLSDGAQLVGVTGEGGGGKTTLIAASCRDERFAPLLPDGVLWITLGQDADGPDLANRINDLSALLSGSRPEFSDAKKAGEYFGTLLEGKRCLLVIDDVWRSSQLEPFAALGRRCRRLVITRFPEVLPVRTPVVEVGGMKPAEAEAVLCAGWPSYRPDQIGLLSARLQAWPLLLALANRAVRNRRGFSVDEAAQLVSDRLTQGPETVDRTIAGHRSATAVAMIEMSVSLLSARHRQRCVELAVFPGDAFIPLATLRTYWARTAGLAAERVEELLVRLDELALVQRCWISGTPAVRVPDVVGDCLREWVGPELAEYHRAFLDAFDRKPTRGPRTGTEWELPPNDPYLRYHAPHHRREVIRVRHGGETRADGPGVRGLGSPLDRTSSVQSKPQRSRRWRGVVLMGTAVAAALAVGVAVFAAQLPPPAPEKTGGTVPFDQPAIVPPSSAPSAPQIKCSSKNHDGGCGALPGGATARSADGKLVTLVPSKTGQVERYVDGKPTPNKIDNLDIRFAPVVLPDENGTLVAFATGNDGNLWYHPDVLSQAAWRPVGDRADLNGEPAVALDLEGKIVVWVKTESEELVKFYQNTLGSSQWTPELMPVKVLDDPSIHPDRNGALRVFFLDKNKQVQSYAKKGMDSWDLLPVGHTAMKATPAVAMDDERELHLFALSEDGFLHQIAEEGGPNSWWADWLRTQDSSIVHAGKPRAAADSAGNLHVLVRIQGNGQEPFEINHIVVGHAGGQSEHKDIGTNMNMTLSIVPDENRQLIVHGLNQDGLVERAVPGP